MKIEIADMIILNLLFGHCMANIDSISKDLNVPQEKILNLMVKISEKENEEVENTNIIYNMEEKLDNIEKRLKKIENIISIHHTKFA